MSFLVHRNNFNGGEISPLMNARVDSEKYGFACRKLENFIPRIYGGAFRRPGMEYIGTVGDTSRKVRLLPFNYSASTRFILEMGHLYMRFWSNGIQVTSGGSPEQVTTPYDEADLFDVQFVQLNDVCYLAHPSYPVQKLTRNADDDWSFEAVTWTYPCFGDENIENITATCSVTSGNGTIDFSQSGFFTNQEPNALADWVGSHVRIGHRRASATEQVALNSSASSSALRVSGTYDVFTYGTWAGTLSLERKRVDGSGTWDVIRTWGGNTDRNISYQGTQLEEAELRLNFTWSSGSGGRALIEAVDSIAYGVVKITSSVDSNTANITVVKAPFSTAATPIWALEAWSKPKGYPRAVAFHEQRLIFGGTLREPSTFWGSTIGDFQNFNRLGFDDSSLAFTLAAQEGSAIQSIVSHRDLVIFTQSEEWRASTSQETTITPSNIFVRRQSRFGASYRQAFVANRSILFIQRGQRKLREFVFNQLEETSDAPDLTLLGEHCTAGGIRQLAFQSQPDPIVWAVTNNGVLLSMTFEREQNVVGWSRHTTQGLVESVAVIYGDEGEADEVWLVCKRTINGVSTRYIERLDPEIWVKLDDPGTYSTSLIFSDASKVVTNANATANLTGLSHLANMSVAVLANGTAVSGLTVSSTGNLTLPSAVTKAVVGLSYDSTLQPTKTELQLPDGTAQGRKALNRRGYFNVWKSANWTYSDDLDGTFDSIVLTGFDGEDASTTAGLFTGEIPALISGSHRNNIDVVVKASQPLPFNLLSLVLKPDFHGD